MVRWLLSIGGDLLRTDAAVQTVHSTQHRLRNWTGAPRSSKRTWAEDDLFRMLFLALNTEAMVGASPHRFRPTYPDFLHGAPPTPACAAFIKESRMKCTNARKVRQEIRSTLRRTWGTRPVSSKLCT